MSLRIFKNREEAETIARKQESFLRGVVTFHVEERYLVKKKTIAPGIPNEYLMEDGSFKKE